MDPHARRVGDLLKRGWSGWGKLHREPASANIMSKLLAKQHLNIRFVINHENKEFHAHPPAWPPSSKG